MNRSLDLFPLLFSFLIVLFAFLISCAPVSAQSSFYKYIDKNGKITFTDRLEAIPEEYREQIKVYKDEAKAETAAPIPGEKAENSPAKIKEADERKKAAEEAAREKEVKIREEKGKRITELQNQIRAKQQEQRDLRTTWMVYDRIKLNQLNEEIASLEKQILSLKKERTQD
jgi:hypothetical protein